MSESMQQVKLGFENINGFLSITDYFEQNDFDINVSLIQSKASGENQLFNANSNEVSTYHLDFNQELIKVLEDISTTENEYFDKKDSEVEYNILSQNDNNLQQFNFDTNNSIGLMSVSSTARSNMVTYAKNNCSKNSPSSGNSSYATYYDFSEIQYAYDCTNFASHCLLAGGAKENHNKWYYDSLTARSSSWSGVNEFHDFIVNNTGTGPQAEARSLAYKCPSQYINWENGDFIQLQEAEYNYPGYGHTTIITGSYADNSYGTTLYTPMITSRTADNWYTKNEVLTVKYPIGTDILAYRLIHLSNFK